MRAQYCSQILHRDIPRFQLVRLSTVGVGLIVKCTRASADAGRVRVHSKPVTCKCALPTLQRTRVPKKCPASLERAHPQHVIDALCARLDGATIYRERP